MEDLGPPPNTNPQLQRTDAEPPPERVTINGTSYPVIYLPLENGNYARYAVMNNENILITSDDNGQRVIINEQVIPVTPFNLAAALNNMNGGRRRSRRRKSKRSSKSKRSRRV